MFMVFENDSLRYKRHCDTRNFTNDENLVKLSVHSSIKNSMFQSKSSIKFAISVDNFPPNKKLLDN